MDTAKEVLELPIEHIIPNRFQPRLTFDEESIKSLSESIKSLGIIQPIVVRKIGDKYEIIAGERRFKAATFAGLTKVPVIVTNVDDKKSAEAALAENIQRKNLTPIEEALSYQSLLGKNNLTQEELAKKMGVSQATIANKIRLLSLSPKVQEAILKEQITERHARSLLSCKNFDIQDKWLERIIKERLTVKQLDDYLKQEKNQDDEIPVISSFNNIEDIINNTTDIVSPIMNKENEITPIYDNQKDSVNYYNELENEPIFMNSSHPTQEPAEINNKSTSLFDDVEYLDFDNNIDEINESIEENKINDIDKEIKLIDLSTPIKKDEKLQQVINDILRIQEEYPDIKFSIDEIDLSSSYKVIISIPKE